MRKDWQGSSSTAVTPMDFRCSMTGATVKPRYLPRHSGRHGGVQLREALHVQLVDQRIAPGIGGRPIGAPVEGAIVATRERSGDRARQLARIGVDQRRRGVEAMALLRLIGSMNVECIVGTRAGAPRRDQAMPNIAGARRQIAALEFGAAFGIEEADLHSGRVAREQREIHAALASMWRPRGAASPPE